MSPRPVSIVFPHQHPEWLPRPVQTPGEPALEILEGEADPLPPEEAASNGRKVLIVHPEEETRHRLQALVGLANSQSAAGRLEALPLIQAAAPTLVITHHSFFKRLVRDLEQWAPGATVAVLCGADDQPLKQTLVGLAGDGYEFITVDEAVPTSITALIRPRSSARRIAPAGLRATVDIDSERITASVVELGNEGLSVLIAPSVASDRFAPGRQCEITLTDLAGRKLMEPRRWTVRNVRAGLQQGVLVGCAWVPKDSTARAPLVITNEVQIRALLRRASHRALRFILTAEGGSQRASFLRGKPDPADQSLTLSTNATPYALIDLLPERVVRLSFEVNGQLTEGLTRVLEVGLDHVRIARPHTLTRWHRRESLRACVLRGLQAQLEFDSPLSGAAVRYRVADLDPAGLGFTFDGAAEVYPPGLVIDRLRLSVSGHVIQCSAVAESSAPSSAEPGLQIARRCGLRLRGLSQEDEDHLREAVIGALAPGVGDGGLLPFEKIWELIEAVGNHFPDYPLEDPACPVTLGHTHQRLGPAHDLARTFTLSDEEGRLMGHASGVRVYSRTWLSGHLMVRPGYHRQMQVSQELTKLTFDYAEALQDVEYTRGFWRIANRWSARVFGGAGSRLLRPGLACMARFWPMRIGNDRALPLARATARAAGDDEIEAFLQYARGALDPVRMRANDLSREELSLASLGQRYAARGLQRERVLGVVDGPDGPAGWVLVERSSPGLMWAEFYNACQLFVPEGQGADDARLSLLHFAAASAKAGGRPVTECLATLADVPALERLGFANLGEARELTLHRSMTREAIFQILAAFEKVARRRPNEAKEEPRNDVSDGVPA